MYPTIQYKWLVSACLQSVVLPCGGAIDPSAFPTFSGAVWASPSIPGRPHKQATSVSTELQSTPPQRSKEHLHLLRDCWLNMNRLYCAKGIKVWCVGYYFLHKTSVVVHLNRGNADGDFDLFSHRILLMRFCIPCIPSQWLYWNLFLADYYKYRRAIYISHRLPHWPPFHRPAKLCWCLYISLSFAHLSHPSFSLRLSLSPLSICLSSISDPALSPLPLLLVCVWGGSIGYSGLEHCSSFSKKSAVEAHESPQKDVHSLRGGIHPPTPFFVLCHVYSCSLILDLMGYTDFPRVSHVSHYVPMWTRCLSN